MVASMMTPPLEHSDSSSLDGGIRKRVCKACDRCRLKKSKCDGSSPCSRCKADNAICVFGERKKSHDKVYPKGYVEMLEAQQAQLVVGLQELYKRTQNGQGWTGTPLKETQGHVLTHDILERLGALKSEGHHMGEDFEEDLSALQAKLIASGATMMQRDMSQDGSSERASSPLYEPTHSRPPKFSNPFAVNQFPPTPPNQSPYPQTVRAVPQSKAQTYPQFPAQSHLAQWSAPTTSFEESLDFTNQYDSPMMDEPLDSMSFPPHMFQDQMAPIAINPMFMMKDWAGQEEFQRFVNPAMM